MIVWLGCALLFGSGLGIGLMIGAIVPDIIARRAAAKRLDEWHRDVRRIRHEAVIIQLNRPAPRGRRK